MPKRVYEYTDQDGNVFYSLTKLPMVTAGHRLKISSRIGTHVQNFVNFIRVQAGQSDEEEPEAE